jgi:quercetin dioxygenase-like cupin family protein
MSDSRKANIIMPGGGETHAIMGMTIHVKTSGRQSDGEFAVLEVTEPPDSGSPTQWHKRTTVLIYVLEGTLTLTMGGEPIQAGTGGFIYVPPATVHAFSNQSDAPVRYLLVYSPAGIEDYITEAMELANAEPSWPPAAMSRLSALREKYDFFDPPVG